MISRVIYMYLVYTEQELSGSQSGLQSDDASVYTERSLFNTTKFLDTDCDLDLNPDHFAPCKQGNSYSLVMKSKDISNMKIKH